MLLKNVYHNANKFDWADKNTSIESSDLIGPLASGNHLYGRLYDDACDVGFILVNPKTENETAWFLSKTIMTPDGEDVVGWEFKPITAHVRAFPKLDGRTITVWND